MRVKPFHGDSSHPTDTPTENGDPETVRDAFANVLDSVRLKFTHGRQLKNGSRRTYLDKIEVDLLPETSCQLTTTSRS